MNTRDLTLLLSIFLATCRPDNIISFLENIREKTSDPTCIEVLIKLDEGDSPTLDAVKEYQTTSLITIKYLISPKRHGYYSLHIGYNELISLASSESYFCVLFTDEIRVLTDGWDNIIRSYVGAFADDIFRLEISSNRASNYYTPAECLYRPDNYPLITKKLLQLIGGWGEFWGPDSWLGMVNFYMSYVGKENNEPNYFRSIPLYNINLSGVEAAANESENALSKRNALITQSFRYLKSLKGQENFLRLANRLCAHIKAQQLGIPNYTIAECPSRKITRLYSKNNKNIYYEFSFSLNKRARNSILKKIINFISKYKHNKTYQPFTYDYINNQTMPYGNNALPDRYNVLPNTQLTMRHESAC